MFINIVISWPQYSQDIFGRLHIASNGYWSNNNTVNHVEGCFVRSPSVNWFIDTKRISVCMSRNFPFSVASISRPLVAVWNRSTTCLSWSMLLRFSFPLLPVGWDRDFRIEDDDDDDVVVYVTGLWLRRRATREEERGNGLSVDNSPVSQPE